VTTDIEEGESSRRLGADSIGELTYRYVGGRVVLLSTWVNRVYRNQRVASELIGHALDRVHPGAGAEAPRNGR
jgi:hypothetical protein